MKKIIALMAAALMTASVYAGEFADISTKDVLTAANAKSAVIIDANGPGSYTTKGHVPTALDFNAIQDNLATSLPKDKSTLIIAYCGNPGCGAYLRADRDQRRVTNIKHVRWH